VRMARRLLPRRAPRLHRSRWHSGCYAFWHMIDPKVITEILKANGITSRSAPGNLTGQPVRDPSEIPAGSAGGACSLNALARDPACGVISSRARRARPPHAPRTTRRRTRRCSPCASRRPRALVSSLTDSRPRRRSPLGRKE